MGEEKETLTSGSRIIVYFLIMTLSIVVIAALVSSIFVTLNSVDTLEVVALQNSSTFEGK